MSSPHKMPGPLVRWWRWWTNPSPCPGEVWTVPGIGAVEILHPAKGDQPTQVRFRTAGGHTLLWWRDRFVERALSGPPTATTLIGTEGSHVRD